MSNALGLQTALPKFSFRCFVVRSSFAEIQVTWMTGRENIEPTSSFHVFARPCWLRWDRYCAVRRVGKATYVKATCFGHHAWSMTPRTLSTKIGLLNTIRRLATTLTAVMLPWTMACLTNIQARSTLDRAVPAHLRNQGCGIARERYTFG